MLYEYSNNPLAWNYHHWTYLQFAYFALVDNSACLLLTNAVKIYDIFMILSWKLFLVTDETARVIIVFLQMSLQYVLKCFRSSMIYLIVVVIFRLRHNFDCLIFNNDYFSTSTAKIKCSGMPVRNINKDSPHHSSFYKYITCGRAFWREAGLVSLCSKSSQTQLYINTSTTHTPPKTIHPAFEISTLWDEIFLRVQLTNKQKMSSTSPQVGLNLCKTTCK